MRSGGWSGVGFPPVLLLERRRRKENNNKSQPPLQCAANVIFAIAFPELAISQTLLCIYQQTFTFTKSALKTAVP